MKLVRILIASLAVVLASCGDVETAADPGVQLAERGIGGTGGLARPLPASPGQGASQPGLPADRGIGGTGVASNGTGIAGMITGFGSVFVNGIEVGLEPDARITVDGAEVPPSALQVGQVAAMSLNSDGDVPSTSTRAVAIRHEVAGRVADVDPEGRLDVAGQPVRLSATTLGLRNPQVGDWVAVSGFRNEAGEIAATRVDGSPHDQVIVHGTLRADAGALRIGTLPVTTSFAMSSFPAGPVTVSGQDVGGILHAGAIAPDLLVADPAAFFGPAVRYFRIETYARGLTGGGIELVQGPHLSGRLPGLSLAGRSVIEFQRGPDGALVATSAHDTRWTAPPRPSIGGLPGAGRMEPRYMPAPVPGRGRSLMPGPGFIGGGGGRFGNMPPRPNGGGPPGPFPPPGH